MYPRDLSDAEWGKIELIFRINYSREGGLLSTVNVKC